MSPGRTQGDRGAALILVLVFIVAIGPILAALVTLTGSNLLNTSNLQTQRNAEFAADTYMDGAIQAVRHQAPPSCPTFPAGAPGTLAPNGVNLRVWCSMGTLQGFYGRNVEFDACPTAATSFATCQSTAVLRAQVIYNDETSTPPCNALPLPASCYGNGTGVTIVSWTLETATH